MAYKRLPLIAFTVVFTLLLAGYSSVAPPAGVWKGFLWVLLAALWLFNLRPLRKALITRPFMKAYMRLLPTMSQTEKEALEAGTVWWDGELFTGKPRFDKLLAAKAPQLTAEEQAFLDGPCEELCHMYDDWEVTHQRGDMPPAMHEAPAHPWSLDTLADAAGMSRSAFADAFRASVGQTPGQYLQGWRIGLAQRALRRGRPLKLIADEVGYGSEAALSRAFKAHSGVSPRAWRQARVAHGAAA